MCELADEIVEAQVREIAEMQDLIRELERNRKQGQTPLPPGPATARP